MLGNEINVRNSEGTLRRYDVVEKNNVTYGVEVKGGTARPTASQRTFDAALNASSGLATVGDRADQAGIGFIQKAFTVIVGTDGSVKK